MRIHDLEPEIILKVDMDSCNASPRKLEKILMEISGINTVVADPGKSSVTVRGKVDPMIVLKVIAETGYSTELLSYQKEPKIEDEEKWSENEKERIRRRTGREKRKHGCPKKHHHAKTAEHDHKVEDYIPPEIDLDVCRDPYCKRHTRRPIITECVPPSSRAYHPRHADGFLCHHGNPFSCHYPRIPPAAYGFYSGRPAHYFSDGYARGCTIM